MSAARRDRLRLYYDALKRTAEDREREREMETQDGCQKPAV